MKTQQAYRLSCAVVLLSFSLAACSATNSYPVLGIRPNKPNPEPSPAIKAQCERVTGKSSAYPGCIDFYIQVEFGQNLAESYRSRATLNRWALYFAGIVAVSGLSVTGGLAAANAGITALRIVPIVTGFVSGISALADNQSKARAYTVAANQIDKVIVDAKGQIIATNQNYRQAAVDLERGINQAKADLENERLDQLTAAQQKLLDDFKGVRTEANKAVQELKQAQEELKQTKDELKKTAQELEAAPGPT